MRKFQTNKTTNIGALNDQPAERDLVSGFGFGTNLSCRRRRIGRDWPGREINRKGRKMARKKVNKLKETEKRTIVGKVIRIFDRSETDKDNPARSEQVQNIELVVVAEQGEEYWQVTCYGAEALARIAGYTLSPDGSAWQQTLEPIKVGDRLAVTGNFRLKPWESRKFRGSCRSRP